MAEEIWEQVAYGDHCIHGTAIGTPGGADLMCGWCEAGLMDWVEQPIFSMGMAFNPDHDGTVRTTPVPGVGNYDDPMVGWSRLERYVFEIRDNVLGPDSEGWQRFCEDIDWEARQVAGGYWTDLADDAEDEEWAS